MENNEMKFRDTFYKDLIEDYQYQVDWDKSLLYEQFWMKDTEELVGKIMKELPKQPERKCPKIKPGNERAVEKWLVDAMKNNPEWAKGLLLKEPPGKKIKEKKKASQKDEPKRRDFWEELCLGDAGYLAGFITDTEYYVWLVKYLNARSKYYKDVGVGNINAHTWLYKLVQAGLRGTVHELTDEMLREKNVLGEEIKRRSKAKIEKDLEKLTALLLSEQRGGGAESAKGEQNPKMDKTTERLHNLKEAGESGEEVDYLLWLTVRLKKMALHIKIKNWLQDSGYPISFEGEIKRSENAPRKQDFTMRLFEAYIDRNYDSLDNGFIRKSEEVGGPAGAWRLENGFYVMDKSLVDALLKKVEDKKWSIDKKIFVPLAVHVYTGCVFFLAGKENYRRLYEEGAAVKPTDSPEEKKKKKEILLAYRNSKRHCCFDYLRLASQAGEEGSRYYGDFCGALRMRRHFLDNTTKSYDRLLDDFKRYCKAAANGPLRSIKAWNEEMPHGIPIEFLWAFEGREES